MRARGFAVRFNQTWLQGRTESDEEDVQDDGGI
jgi:hypothetical protein